MLTRLVLLSSLALFSFPACTGGGGDGSGSGGGGGGGGGGGTGGGSGLPGTTQLNDLSPDQVMTFCQWSIDEQGGEELDTDCGDGVTVSSGTVSECTESFSAFPACDLTVSQTEGCIAAIAADPCNGIESAACAAFFTCISGG